MVEWWSWKGYEIKAGVAIGIEGQQDTQPKRYLVPRFWAPNDEATQPQDTFPDCLSALETSGRPHPSRQDCILRISCRLTLTDHLMKGPRPEDQLLRRTELRWNEISVTPFIGI